MGKTSEESSDIYLSNESFGDYVNLDNHPGHEQASPVAKGIWWAYSLKQSSKSPIYHFQNVKPPCIYVMPPF